MSEDTSQASADRLRDAAVEILRTLRREGHVAYLAGGCVRDELIGLSPKDYDVATDARPDRIAQLFRRTQSVGAAFGVMLVRERGVTIEVATFRSEGPYSDRRRPDHVDFADPPADAARRDFTINALFLDPLQTATDSPNGADSAEPATPSPPGNPQTRRTARGLVIDYVGGMEDLARKLVRAVGDPEDRLKEDHLRALRAVRLASRLAFTIDDATAAAIRRHARDLEGVSRERIGDEVRRMLSDPSRALAAWTLQYLELDAPVLKGPHLTRAPRRLGRLSGEPPYHTCLAAWALDRGAIVEATQIAGLVAHWRGALCLTNEERDGLKAVLTTMSRLIHEWAELPVAQQKRLVASPAFLEAHRLIGAENPEEMVRIRRRVRELENTPSGTSPEPLISGNDLLELGVRAGPGFQHILDALYDAQLEERIRTRSEALEMARELAAAGDHPA